MAFARLKKKTALKSSQDRATQAFTGQSGKQIDQSRLEQMIRDRAYFLWEEMGKPQGKDSEIWAQAEREILDK